jgi:hypothetical protein
LLILNFWISMMRWEIREAFKYPPYCALRAELGKAFGKRDSIWRGLQVVGFR